jgi:hypothetical protein
MRQLLTFLLAFTVMATAQKTPAPPSFPDAQELNRMAARFAPAPLQVDTPGLSAGDQKALARLIEAARIVNPLFMQQLWSGNLALYHKLQQDKTPLGQARLRYFWINKSPWSEIDEHKAFLPGVPAKKPAGANFYPEDMTKEEFEAWVKTLPTDQKNQALGFFTVVRRGADKKLKLVPYNVEYKTDLTKASALLRSAPTIISKATWRGWTWTRPST